MLAEKLGVKNSYLSNVETGRTGVSIQKLAEIASILNQPMAYFFQSNEQTFETQKKALPGRIVDIEVAYRTKEFNIENIADFMIELFGNNLASKLAIVIMEKIGSRLSDESDNE